MEFQITNVRLSKEIAWDEACKRDHLFVEMMRNRLMIEATASFPEQVFHDNPEILWEKFLKDLRKNLDSNNIGLYAVKYQEYGFDNGKRIWPSIDRPKPANQSKGHIVIYFEDAGDYARYVKDHAVTFKLSINTQ